MIKGTKNKHLVDEDGAYIGTYSAVEIDGEEVWPDLPENYTEATSAPYDKRQVWNGSEWSDPVFTTQESRKAAYVEAEEEGTLPSTVIDNIDEIWKALEELSTNGLNLPSSSIDIIEKRRSIKDNYTEDS